MLSALDLPIDIPWRLIGVSPDMMDTTFGGKAFPFAFRSSIAVSAFEPSVSDLPPGICDERVTYIKVSASITGYQPTPEEVKQGHAYFPDVPTEELNRVFADYWGCYGVLLNVAVFPHSDVVVENQQVCDQFTDTKVGAQTQNPWVRGEVTYQVMGQDHNEVVDTYPPGGDGKPELDLGTQMTVTFPACAGVSAAVAQRQPAPQTQPICVSFETLTPGTTVPSPYVNGGVTFVQQGSGTIGVVDRTGNGQGELDLTDGFTIDFASCSEVDVEIVQGYAGQDATNIEVRAFSQGNLVAEVYSPGDGTHNLKVTAPAMDRLVFTVHHPVSSLVQLCRYVTTEVSPQAVTMDVYAGDEFVGTATAGAELGRLDTLSVEGTNVDRAIFKSPTANASLIEFCRAVPQSHPVGLADYPHIVEFEPKTRDLYQAATLQGEVLTASSGEIKTDKTLSHGESSQTGLSLGATYTTPPSQYGSASVSGSLSHSWGETSQDTMAIQGDSSRERRETQGTTTNINQMYNLLTGYHLGTNRAAFIMLPRPHMLQPTDHRTFIQGLRIIEGVQDFFLIVRLARVWTGYASRRCSIQVISRSTLRFRHHHHNTGRALRTLKLWRTRTQGFLAARPRTFKTSLIPCTPFRQAGLLTALKATAAMAVSVRSRIIATHRRKGRQMEV